MNDSLRSSFYNHQSRPAIIRRGSDGIKNVLKIIAEYHLAKGDFLQNDGLLNGRMGLALFFFRYYEYTQDEKYLEIGSGLVTETVENIANSKVLNPYLANGLAGILWGLNLLYQRGYLADPPIKIFSEETYNYLKTVAHRAVALENNDYLFGSLGIIAFLNSEEWDVNELLTEIIENKILHKRAKGPKKMLTSLKYKDNLTLAHGEAGFLAVLLQVFRKSKNTEKITHMIEQVCCKLLNKINNTGDDTLSFPDFIDNNIDCDLKHRSQLAWSTGELSISYNLLEALELLKEHDLVSKVSEHIKQLANYTANISSFQDIFFYHGSIGYTYLFHKLYQKLEIESLSNASDFWLKTVLDYYDHKTPFEDTDNFPSTLRFGILNGSAGVGLSLMSIASGNQGDTYWDKVLLL